MKIKNIKTSAYTLQLTNGALRHGVLIEIEDSNANCGCGDLAPLPQRNKESLQDALAQFEQKRSALCSIDWVKDTFLETLYELKLVPSLEFALESALFSILSPLPPCSLEVSALLMGSSSQEIIKLAEQKKLEGYKNAKLKIGNLSVDEAYKVISILKGWFRLRVDVNSAWRSKDVLDFFAQFSLDSFDYVEDPLPLTEMEQFLHPIAVEEPLSKGIALSQLEAIPMLKAIVYKPTVHGGLHVGRFYQKWSKTRNIDVVLSSSFESDVGHFHLAATAFRLGIKLPIGIGTYHYLNNYQLPERLKFSAGKVHLS